MLRRSLAARRSRLALALVLGLSASAPQLLAQGPARSLEELLRRARAQESALLERLAEPVRSLIERLEEERGAELAKAEAALAALGPAASPLLLAWLEPGSKPEAGARRRAAAVAEVLRTVRAPGIADGLIRLAREGSPSARHHALRVLPRIPETARARRALLEALAGEREDARLDATLGLGELATDGDTESLAPLRALLVGQSTALTSAALQALAAAGDAGAGQAVLAIASDPVRSRSLANAVVDFLTAVVDVERGPVAKALIASAAQAGLTLDERVPLLEAVARLEPSVDRVLRKAFDPLLDSGNPKLIEEAQVCLTRLGDRTARRDLIRRYDDWVRTQDTWPTAYEDRAAMLMRIGEFADAAKDYATAIELRNARSRTAGRELYVALARAQVRAGKLKQAYEALSEAYLTQEQLKALGADPDFEPLVAHSRYGRIFGG